jgi:hypothetical protein
VCYGRATLPKSLKQSSRIPSLADSRGTLHSIFFLVLGMNWDLIEESLGSCMTVTEFEFSFEPGASQLRSRGLCYVLCP